MRILGIETSCDETAIAIIQKQDCMFVIEKNVLASQAKIHAKYGGVVPEIAAREHAQLVFQLLDACEISHDGNGIDAIAVTVGPGLIPALRVGVELGKTLAWCWSKPLIAMNHLEGHIYSVWKTKGPNPEFPSICLLVSGGHTELILMKDHGVYELLGMTRDDAAGEAFDKVAKLLGLGYPGGSEISRIAKQGDPNAVAFPRPMIDTNDFDFSFSGLKTAVKNYLYQSIVFNPQFLSNIAASFQQAVVETLVTKTIRAVQIFHPRSVILSGGVSANLLLRATLKDSLEKLNSTISFFAPDFLLTGDNAVMIAIAGAYRAQRQQFIDPFAIKADANLRLA